MGVTHDPFVLLRHAEGAGPTIAAARLGVAQLEAGRRAYARGAISEAAVLLEEAVGNLPAPESVEAELHLGLAFTSLGRLEEADELLDRVVEGSSEVTKAVLAAVGHRPLGQTVRGDERRLARLRRVFVAMPADPSPERLDVVGALVLEETLVDGEVRTTAALDELIWLAERLDDAPSRARLAYFRALELRDAPGAASRRLGAAEMAFELAVCVEDPLLRLDALELLAGAALGAAQLERCEDLIWELGRLGARVNRPRSVWVARLLSSALLAATGDEGADRSALAAMQLGGQCGIPDAVGAFGVQMLVRQWLAGDLEVLRPVIDQAVSTYPHIAAWHAASACAHSHATQWSLADRELDAFLQQRLTYSAGYFDRPGLCLAADTALRLGRLDAARQILDFLLPDDRAVITVGVGLATFGPANLFVAMAENVIGRHSAARTHCDAAERLASELGWVPWIKKCREFRDDYLSPS